MAFATASWASITSSENPSTDGSYTISWSSIPNAASYQLYEDGTLVHSTGTSRSFSGKKAGSYTYTVGYCEFIFEEEMCFGSGYTALTVTVSSAPPPTPAPTVSASFNKSSIPLGGSATLTWSSSNATRCSGSPSIGSTAKSGTKTFTPSSAGEFTVKVTCTGAGGSGSDSDSVTVNAPPTVSASFDKGSIPLGDNATLTWSSTNATRCSGSPSIGSTAKSGTKTFTPSSAGKFTVKVTCTGAGGSGSDSDSVTVKPPPTVSASFDESSITLGEDVELTWSSTNATSCSGSPSIGSTATSGTKTYTPSSTGSFSVTVTCTGAGGSGNDSDSVTVKAKSPPPPPPPPPPPEVSASFAESSITLGDSATLTWSSTNATRCSGSPSIGSTATSGTKTYTPARAGRFGVTVTCTGAGGSDSDSDRVTVNPPPPAPTLTVPATDADGRYRVSWTASSGATRYELQEKSGSGSFGNVYRGSGTSRNITGKANGTYSYRVRACNSTCGDWSSTGTVRVGDLTASPNPSTDGSYTVSWPAILNAESYQLYENGAPVHGVTGTSRSFSGKAAGSYKYTLSFCELIYDVEFCDQPSGYAALTVTVAPPPTLTVPATDADGTYTASWTAPAGATSYKLEEKPAGGSFSNVYNGASTSHGITGKAAGTYAYRVQACAGSNKCGGWSATETTKVPPGAPELTVPATDTDGRYPVRWTSPSGATSYELQEKSGSGSFGDVYSGSGTSRNITGKAGGTYSYRVRACAGSGNCGGWSATESVRVERPSAPGAPTLTVPPTDADGDYTASWTAPAGATSYKLEEKSDGGSFSNVYDGAGTSHEITGKAAGIYAYRVQACTGSGNCGGWSSTETTKVPPGAPTLTVPTTDADGRYPVRWTSPSGATSYELQEKSGSGSFGDVYSGNSASRNITGKANGTYSYRVRACAGSNNCGGWSATESVRVGGSLTASPNPSTDGSYTVSWAAVPNAESYQLYENGRLVYDSTGTSWSFSGKTVGGYKYTLEFCELIYDEEHCDLPSGYAALTVTVTTTPSAPSAPSAPTLTVPATDADGRYTATWTSPSGATRYELQEKVGAGAWSASESLTTTRKNYTGKTPAVYMYRVRACAGSDNCGGWSSTGTTKVPPGVPTLKVPPTDADGSYTVSWTSPAGATSYKLQEKSGSGSFGDVYSGSSASRNITGKASGTYSYRVRACAGSNNCGGWSATESVAVSVSTNRVPEAEDDTARTPFGTAVVIAVLENDTDADDDDLTVTAVTPPANGTAEITSDADGNSTLITYTPKSGHPGADTFDYTVSDGTDSATGTVSVSVDLVTVTPNPSTTGSYTLSWDSAAANRYQVLEIGADGNFISSNYHSTTSVRYSGKASGEYTYSVRRCNVVLGRREVCVLHGRATARVELPPEVTVDASFDRSSITLGDSATLTWSSKNATRCSGSPSTGSMATSGKKKYTPPSAGSFEVTVTCTGAGGSASDTASVRVTSAPSGNNAPVAVDDAARTAVGTAVEIAVLANDTDADDDDLTVTAVTTPTSGTATITRDGDGNDTLVTYTPQSGYSGTATFDYTVSDGTDTDTGTVTVTVSATANLVKVTPNPSATGSYTLSWQGTLLADRYRVSESVPGGESLWSDHLTTRVEYTGKATGNYYYTVFRCHTPLGQEEICEEYGSARAEVVLPITPGNLPYRSGVTKGGDAYVNVPIAPAPGVNGLAPRLSIDYSGGRERHRSDQELPADMIGYGWRVGGFSTIRRCVKGTDDSDGISFNGDDALCLDGEPLTKINDTQHLTGGAEYRTSRESFAKIVLVDDASGDWFEVRLPDGTVREYGHTADSQLWKPAREASATQTAQPAAPFLWSINKQTDAFGNVMKYEYHEDNTKLARHPKKIVYGDAEDATIEFVYKPRDDLDSRRLGSYFLSQPQRLTYIHLRLDGSLVRDYRLAYKTTSAGRVRLNALQTCGYEPSGTRHCLSPLKIGWLDAAGGTWVNQLTDPMGAATTFAMETLTASDPHDFALDATDTPFGATSLPANTRALPAKNGDVKPVVTGVTRSDGIGGTRRTRYAYLGRGVENTRNWGFLGFHAIRETDEASGISTYTQYRLDYPFLGRPAQVVRYKGEYVRPTSARRAKTPLSKRAVRYAQMSVPHTPSTATTTLPHAEETMEWLYEGTSTLGVVQTTETLTLPSKFVTQVVRETRTGHGATGDGDGGSDWGAGQSHTLTGVQRTTQQTLSFDNDETDWVLGFVGDIDVKHYGGDAGGTPDWTETVERTAIEGTLAPDVVTRFPNDDESGDDTESGDNSEPEPDFEHRTDYDYDSEGNREEASETAAGSTRTWEVVGFSAGRFPTSWKNPLRHTERATYHVGLGVPATTADANNRRTSYTYDGLGREISRTRHWDSAEVTKDGKTTTEDVKTTTTYASCDDANTCDAVEATVAQCGTRYSVAPVMKVTTTAPDVPDSTAYLDMFGRAIRTAVEGFGGTDRRVDVFHDALGRIVCESEPHHAGETAEYTRYKYDIRDRLTGATRPDGGKTEVKYTAASNQVTATVTETVKASNGTEATTRKTERTHNVLGELVSTVEGAEQPGDDTAEGAEQTDADADKPVKTSYAYDGAGRLETVTTGGQTTTFAYDAAGNRESVTNPNLGATVSAGDAMVSVKFKHNGHGELTEREDARGATYYLYDELGRRTCAADSDGTATWEYDLANGTGLLERRSYDRDTVLTDPSSCAFGSDFSETYTYNTDARLETVTTAIVDDQTATPTTLTHSYAYDDYGRPSSTTYPSSVTVKHEYNDRGYLEKLKHGETELAKVTAQTAYGQSQAVTYGNGVRTERSYDELGRLTDIDTTRGAAKIQDNAYAWRSDGSLERRIAGAAGSRSKREEAFDYDYLNRLTGAKTYLADSATASRTLAFKYDPRGNLKTKTSDASADKSTTGYDYFPGTNRLREATIGDVDYTFAPDTSGHITHYACTDPDDTDQVDPCADVDDTFIDWNARGLAEKVTVGESADAAMPTARDSFHYGPDGARYFKKSEWAVESGNTTTMKTSRKYYAGAYEKTATVGGDTVERVRIGDSVVHVRTTPAGAMATATSAFEYAHRDHLGSVEAVTDASGNELAVLGHDPYGERRKLDWTRQLTKAEIEALLNAHGERVSRGFTRHEHLDRTGLIHMNGRMYDPRLGRFLSPDPIVGDPTSSQSWNLYSYVGNNPLSYVDPTGLVQAGPCGSLYSGCMHFGGGGGGSTTRTVTVTTTVTVHGVMAVPYRREFPVWTEVWDPSLDHYVWHVTYDHFWDEVNQPYSYSYNVTRTVAVPDESVAEQPADDKWTQTDQAAAERSSRVYRDHKGGLLGELGIEYDPRHGFGAALYKVGDGYMLAFRGTDQRVDWPGNIKQGVGLRASQYEQAIKLAERVYDETGGNVMMVGHSLGGGLATAAAHATGARAVTFNAAGLHSRYRDGSPGDIRAHYIAGDPLTRLQGLNPLMPRAAGTRIRHRYRGPESRHSIKAFLDL